MEPFFYVTGCDTGFGATAVRMLADQKRKVFAGYYAEASRAALEADGNGFIIPVQLDVTSDESVAAAAALITDTVKAAKGRLEGVVNNAGLMVQVGPIEWTPLSNHQRMMEVNYYGTVRVTNSVLPLLRRSEGRVVNVASVAGRHGFSQLGAYSATKHAVEGYSESLRRELLPFGVTVHTVEPGVFGGTSLYESFKTGFEQLFEKLDPKLQQDYGVSFRDSTKKEMIRQFALVNNTDLTAVPKAYVHALTSTRPSYRYRVGTDSWLTITIASWLPEAWQDTIGYEGVPASVTPQARKRAMKRYPTDKLTRFLLLSVLGFFLVRLVRWRMARVA